jgi:hypothetical protein
MKKFCNYHLLGIAARKSLKEIEMINIVVPLSDELEKKIVADIKKKTDCRLIDIANAHCVSLRAVYAIAKKHGLSRNRGIGSDAYRVNGRSVQASGEER